MKTIRALVLYAHSTANSTLSYQRAWPRHLVADPRFRCTAINVLTPNANRRARVRLRISRFDAIIVLHSVFSNANHLNGRLFDAVGRVSTPKTYFIGNEYKLMPEKMAFCEELGVDLLVSQFTHDEPLALYRARLPNVQVVGIPNTGWDPKVFQSRVPAAERPIDLGYRAFDTDFAVGHRERAELAERFRRPPKGLTVDVSLAPADRFDERGWAAFLNRCKGQLGSEAGGDYFELTDATRRAVQAYLADKPDASFDEVHELFFRNYASPVSGRLLSGRVVEAAATKTAQILIEGAYGGYFDADVHFIPLRKDFANLGEAIEKFNDHDVRQSVTENAFEVAQGLTYRKLIDEFHGALAPLL